jgi:FtsH-binding integral membrane protein
MPLIETVLGQPEVFTLYLPFLLVFALFYALLVKTKVFGKGGNVNKINALVALIAALYVAVFSPFAASISIFFATLFAQASVGLVALLIFVMFVGLLLGPFVTSEEGWDKLGKRAIPLLVIAAFLFTLWLFFSSAATATWFEELAPPTFGLTGEDVALIVLVIITLVILYWLVSSGPAAEEFEWTLKPKR